MTPSPAATIDDRDHLDRTLHVAPWPDPVVEDVGHDPRSAYVERFWLPVLGPSTVLLLRRLTEGLDTEPDGYDVPLGEVAAQLGLGIRGGRQQPVLRAIDRACTFGAARQLSPDHLAVRRAMAPLTARQLGRLAPPLRAEHDQWLSQGGSDQPGPAALTVDEQRQRARALALSLLQLGESIADAERQLHRWRFHPALAHEAMRWAGEQIEAPSPSPS